VVKNPFNPVKLVLWKARNSDRIAETCIKNYLTDAQWQAIQSHASSGILYVLCTGCRWKHIYPRIPAPRPHVGGGCAAGKPTGLGSGSGRPLLQSLDEQGKLESRFGISWAAAVRVTKRGKDIKLILVVDGRGVASATQLVGARG